MKKEINNEELENVGGGRGDFYDPYTYICDGTVVTGLPVQRKVNGLSFSLYTVRGDDGKEYNCVWPTSTTLDLGIRVQIVYAELGPFKNHYVAEYI